MIDIIEGKVIATTDSFMVVMVGGIGFRVIVTKDTVNAVYNGSITLYTHLIVREDSLTLYGFKSYDERSLFELLISVKGVGPRIAIAILNEVKQENLWEAINTGNPEIITTVRGVGKKLVQNIINDLKNKRIG